MLGAMGMARRVVVFEETCMAWASRVKIGNRQSPLFHNPEVRIGKPRILGDIGGGVLLDPENLDWILTTTGIPEPAAALLVIWTIPFWLCRRRCP